MDRRYLPASESAANAPAGEMWSVVIESPSLARHLALLMLFISGSSKMSSKNGGFLMYVEFSSQEKRGESLHLTASHLSDPLKMFLYFETKVLLVTYSSTSFSISQSAGQMSLR